MTDILDIKIKSRDFGYPITLREYLISVRSEVEVI